MRRKSQVGRDLIGAPLGEILTSHDKEFVDAFNKDFSFHDAEVLSNSMDLSSGDLELIMNYIVRWELVGTVYKLSWRKLRLKMEGVFWIDFYYFDPEYGFPHSVTRHIELNNIDGDKTVVLGKLNNQFKSNLMGADLDDIEAAKFGEKSRWLSGVRLDFEWGTAPNETIVFTRVWCTRVALDFLSGTSLEREQPWAPTEVT